MAAYNIFPCANEEFQLIHREIGLLRTENQDQNNEIAFLKEKVQSLEKAIDKIELKHEMMKEPSSLPEKGSKLQKRPARLLPYQVL